MSLKVEQQRAFNRRSALRDSLLSLWTVDIHRALRMRDDRQVVVDASAASQFSLYRVADPWPSCSWSERDVFPEGRRVCLLPCFPVDLSTGLHAFVLFRPVGFP